MKDIKTIINSTLSSKVNTIICLSLTIIFSSSFLLLAPYLLGTLISEITAPTLDKTNVIFYVITAALAVLLRLLLQYIQLKQSYKLGNAITTELQKEAYSYIMKADLTNLGKTDPKVLTDCICKDCVRIGNEYVSKTLVKYVNNLCIVVGAVIVSLLIAPILGVMIIAFIPIYYFSVNGMRKLFKNSQTKVDYLNFEENKLIEENFTLLREIKIKNGVNKEIKDYKNWLDQNNCKFKHNFELNNLNSGLIRTIITSITLVGVVGFGLFFYVKQIGDTSLGNICTCAIYIPFIFRSVLNLMDTKVRLSTVSNEVNNLNEIFKLRSEQRSEPITQLDEISSIKFNNVCYDDGLNVIRDLSFEIKNNEKLGILCLENTSTELVQELFIKIKKHRSGTITFNNCEYSKISTFYLRDVVTSIGSGSRLFEDSIINNITYPLPFDEYKYNDSLYKARLKDIIFDLENKDQTLVTDLSEEVQEQISLANAFYKDSKVFVFNSVTKKINPKLADEIQKEILKLKNKFIIVVSDKGHDVTGCDKVVILKNGEIVESGNVHELMKNRDSVLYSSVRRIRVRHKVVS